MLTSCIKNDSLENVVTSELPAPQSMQIITKPTSVKMSWSSVKGAHGYLVEIAKGTSFNAPFFKSDKLSVPEIEVVGLEPQMDYVVRLNAVQIDNPSATSKSLYKSFRTIASETTDDAIAFPGAEGFAKNITGGRGGKVIKVVNLNDAGSGSLRAAINETGKRIIVFEISGTITLKSNLSLKNNDVTIAGQTAPGDGITLRDYPVYVDADNVIVRFLRFRMGDAAQQEGDALGARFRKNIIIDHCSMSWSTDECVSFYANENTTIQWCLIAESLRNSVHGKGAHGYGGIWGGKKATFHHNLLAHHDSRNARLGEEAGKAFALTDLTDIRNNVIYNWASNSFYGGEAMNVNMVNNYFKPGPATIAKNSSSKQGRIISIDKNKITGTEVYDIWGKFFVNGNVVEGNADATNDNWKYGVYNQFHGSYGTVSETDKLAMRLTAPHPIDDNIITYAADKAYQQVVEFVGASLVRDAVDKRIINDVKNKTFTANGSNGSTNGIIDTHSDVGGWPDLKSGVALKDTDNDGMPDDWETANKLDPTKANASGRDISTGYDNIEVYINSLVKNIIEEQKN
ncbi:pectate lyase [Niabella ginsengisoli]|uniref:Pectate lyase n=1 Tax=Niabella ginsengisoli TaxID=522298 RepID=A0ABS9SPD6_9BACT|nr:pectate lyase [Niabella ginsengisoli]MCH5600219.1 pectate lyase [Niabella ginsengisoli]